MTERAAPQYLFDPRDKPQLPVVDVPLVIATDEALAGYGRLVSDADGCPIEIVRWPAQGWRPVDADSGDEGGIARGVFRGAWKESVLYGHNAAVNGEYVLGWCERGEPGTQPEHVLLWHMNYHPDGGQLFFPIEQAPFVVPLALPGDDIEPRHVTAFWFDGSQGLYIHPDIWHEGVFPVSGTQSFDDRQGKVHARVSCDFGQEFGIYLKVPLTRPG